MPVMASDDLLKRIGARIRERRKSVGLTQANLAGEEFTKSFTSQVENGQTWPSLQALAHIANRLGCNVSYLIGATEAPSDDPIDIAATRAGITPAQARRFLSALGDGAGPNGT